MEFRAAVEKDIGPVMEIIRQAQLFLGSQGIDQWQSGYPDEEVLQADVSGGHSYLLAEKGVVLCTAALYFDEEPAYNAIYEGEWRGCFPYGTVHRLAVSGSARGRGIAALLLQKLEEISRQNGVFYMRTDTHQGNLPMQALLQKTGFAVCGQIFLDGGPEDGQCRLAYDKLLK